MELHAPRRVRGRRDALAGPAAAALGFGIRVGALRPRRTPMIRFLNIKRLAVIEDVSVDLDTGFTVLTGETGAGKSILVEAIGLLLGNRAAADMVRTGADTAVVQATLEGRDGRETIIRREVSSQGRSRAFIDDAMVTLTTLRERVAGALDLFGQGEHWALVSGGEQRAWLDRAGALESEMERTSAAFERYETARAALEATQMDDRERAARLDLLTAQLADLQRLAPQPDEDDRLIAERQILASADTLHGLAAECYDTLYEGEDAVLGRLAQVWRRLDRLSSLDARFAPYATLREGVHPPLEDFSLFLRSYLGSLDASPERLQAVEDRLAALERAKRRFGGTLAAVLDRQREIQRELDDLGHSADRLAELEAAAARTREEYLAAARTLSRQRREQASALEGALVRALAQLAMPQARCHFAFGTAPEVVPADAHWTRAGFDTVELRVSANPGEEARPIARVASGGELSRLMLALKTLAPDLAANGRTLIFDEVDAGIGGRVADVVGAKLRSLGETAQVLCITHLPQVAAHATTHFRVDKHVAGGRTMTTVTHLSGEARVEEIARMMGGEVTPKVRAGALDMLTRRAGSEPARPPGAVRPTAKA